MQRSLQYLLLLVEIREYRETSLASELGTPHNDGFTGCNRHIQVSWICLTHLEYQTQQRHFKLHICTAKTKDNCQSFPVWVRMSTCWKYLSFLIWTAALLVYHTRQSWTNNRIPSLTCIQTGWDNVCTKHNSYTSCFQKDNTTMCKQMMFVKDKRFHLVFPTSQYQVISFI